MPDVEIRVGEKAEGEHDKVVEGKKPGPLEDDGGQGR